MLGKEDGLVFRKFCEFNLKIIGVWDVKPTGAACKQLTDAVWFNLCELHGCGHLRCSCLERAECSVWSLLSFYVQNVVAYPARRWFKAAVEYVTGRLATQDDSVFVWGHTSCQGGLCIMAWPSVLYWLYCLWGWKVCRIDQETKDWTMRFCPLLAARPVSAAAVHGALWMISSPVFALCRWACRLG